MAEIKSLIRDARKFIAENKFKDAQECCKNILQKDNQNYFGLVLMGKSLQDSDQAPAVYRKAIKSKPDHPLAWIGLANFYERKENSSDKVILFSIYEELLNLQIEEEKTIEILLKLEALGCALKNDKSFQILMKYVEQKLNPKIYEVAEKAVIELLKAGVQFKHEDIQILLKILQKKYIENQNDFLEMLQAKVIFHKPDFPSAVEEIISLPFFTTNIQLKTWLCKELCIKYIENMSFCGINIEKHIDNISKDVQNSKYPLLLRSMISYDNGLYIETYKQCAPLVKYNEFDIIETTLLIKCGIMLKQWSLTEELILTVLSNNKDEKFTITLKKLLLLALNKQKKWKQAISVAKDIPFDLMESEDLARLAECSIEANEPVDHIMKQVEISDHFKQLEAQMLIKEKQYDKVIDLEESDDNPMNVFYIAIAYWELKWFDKSFSYLLKSVKLNPDHADTFLYLGYFYKNHQNNLEKAKNCFENANALNPKNPDIAKILSETYAKLQQNDLDFELLISLTGYEDESTSQTWIYFRLGLHYLSKRKWENAITCFKIVIKHNSNDATAYECMADAYYARGSYLAALKAFKQVMTLNSDKPEHCMTRIGYIHLLQTEYLEALKAFEQVLKIQPESTLALKGITETWLGIAKKKENDKAYGSARDCAQHATEYILKALHKEKQFLCFWKLLGDTLMFIIQLPNKYAYVYMPSLTHENCNMHEISRKDKLELFPQAISCYSRITKQRHQVTSYDLAAVSLRYFYETKSSDDINLSFNLIINCIKESPTSWLNWNLLGKIFLVNKKYNLSQHCFIKALLTEKRNNPSAKVWCNLGALYLKLGLFMLANHCFWRGQSILPSYTQSWIGQALIAEVIREQEAMDLFRHATRLGYHPESALGYADWVCRNLKNNKYKENSGSKYEIEELNAIQYATDLIEWYCHFNASNACAYNILGFLQERQGLLRSAKRSYEAALKYAKDDKKNIVLLNLGRILVRMKEFDEALIIYKAVTEASFNSTAGLALALFRKGLYEESYSAYDTALQWLSNDDSEQADLLIAMAGIIYTFKGADDAKTLLFRSIEVSQKRPTPNSLFAICSLGLLQSDQSLSKLAVGELRKYDKDPKYAFDIMFLKSYLYICENDVDLAIKLLSRYIHEHPNNAQLWYCMTQFCLKTESTKQKIASSCAHKALSTARYGENDCNDGKILASAVVAEHMAGANTKSLRLAKSGLHMFPNQVEIWGALLMALYSDTLSIEKKNWLLAATEHIRRHLDVSDQLNQWLHILKRKINM